MADETEPHSPIHSIFEASVEWHVVRGCGGKSAPFCWPLLAAGVAVFCERMSRSCSVGSALCDPVDCSPPDSSVHRIPQARILEWVAIPFSVHLISLLSIFRRCNGFTGIQKAFMDQTSSRWPNSDRDLFWVQVWLWEVLWSFLVQPLSWLLYKILCLSHVIIQSRNGSLLLHLGREDNTSKRWFFFFFGQLMRHPLIKRFHLSNLLQRPNDRNSQHWVFWQLLV